MGRVNIVAEKIFKVLLGFSMIFTIVAFGDKVLANDEIDILMKVGENKTLTTSTHLDEILEEKWIIEDDNGEIQLEELGNGEANIQAIIATNEKIITHSYYVGRIEKRKEVDVYKVKIEENSKRSVQALNAKSHTINLKSNGVGGTITFSDGSVKKTTRESTIIINQNIRINDYYLSSITTDAGTIKRKVTNNTVYFELSNINSNINVTATFTNDEYSEYYEGLKVKYFVLDAEKGTPINSADQGSSNYYPNDSDDGGVLNANVSSGFMGGKITYKAFKEASSLDLYNVHGYGNDYVLRPANIGRFGTKKINWYAIKVQNDGIHVDGYVSGNEMKIRYHRNLAPEEHYDFDAYSGDEIRIKSFSETNMSGSSDYTFDYWASDALGGLPHYKVNETYVLLGGTYDLYAMWKHNDINITSSIEHGTITPQGNVSVAYEGNQQFTYYADPGYKVNEVIIDGVNIDLAANKSSYTFSNVVSNHTIIVKCIANVREKDITINNYEGIYDGENHKIKLNNLVEGDIVTYSIDGINYFTDNFEFKNVSNNKVYYRVVNEQYLESTINGFGTVNISKKPLMITSSSDEKIYDGSALTNDNFKIEGLVKEESVDVYVSGKITNQGSIDNYFIVNDKFNILGNYDVKHNYGTLTITPRVVKIKANDDTKVYDGKALENNGYELIGSFVENEGLTKVSVSGSQKDVGSSSNKVTGYILNSGTKADNYNISLIDGTLTVTKSADTIILRAKDVSKVYDGTPLVGITYELVNGSISSDEHFVVTYSGEITNVGSKTYSISSVKVFRGEKDVTSNYNFGTHQTGRLEIIPKDVSIIMNEASKAYDTPDPEFTYQKIEGLIGEDKINVLYTCRNNSSEEVGVYKDVIACGYEKNDNYKVRIIPADFTIYLNDTLSGSAANKEVIYDGNTRGIEVSDISQEDAKVVSTYYLDGKEINGKPKDVGKYDVVTTISKEGYRDYILNNTLIIKPRELTIKVLDSYKEYNTKDPEFKIDIVEGLVDDNDLGEIKAYRSNDEEKVGIYNEVLDVRYKTNNNYHVVVTKGTFEILTSEALDANSNDITKIYDANSTEINVTSNMEDVDTTIEYYDNDGNKIAGTPIDSGEYLAKYTVSKYGYYPIEKEAKITINKSLLRIVPLSNNKIQGSIDPKLEANVYGLYDRDKLNYQIIRDGGEASGQYPIKVTYNELNNYVIIVEEAIFTITPQVVPIDEVLLPPAVFNVVNPNQIIVEEVAAPEIIEENATPKVEVVNEDATPKANLSYWALLNLIATILSALMAIIILFGKHSKEEEDEDETNEYTRRRWTKPFSIILAIISIVIFVLTENVTLPIRLFDKYTVVMIMILLAQVVVLVIAKKYKKSDTQKEHEREA